MTDLEARYEDSLRVMSALTNAINDAARTPGESDRMATLMQSANVLRREYYTEFLDIPHDRQVEIWRAYQATQPPYRPFRRMKKAALR